MTPRQKEQRRKKREETRNKKQERTENRERRTENRERKREERGGDTNTKNTEKEKKAERRGRGALKDREREDKSRRQKAKWSANETLQRQPSQAVAWNRNQKTTNNSKKGLRARRAVSLKRNHAARKVRGRDDGSQEGGSGREGAVSTTPQTAHHHRTRGSCEGAPRRRRSSSETAGHTDKSATSPTPVAHAPHTPPHARADGQRRTANRIEESAYRRNKRQHRKLSGRQGNTAAPNRPYSGCRAAQTSPLAHAVHRAVGKQITQTDGL